MGNGGKKVEKAKGPVEIKGQAAESRVDVAIVIGRPSFTLEKNESPEEKEQMESWRGAAKALAPTALEGLTVGKPFADLGKQKKPIGKLYIICHADTSGIGEINPQGQSVSTTVDDLARRIKNAIGSMGEKAPRLLQFLSCFGGGSPETMSKIGKAVGAITVRAPIQTTVISGPFFKIGSGKGARRLTIASIKSEGDPTLSEYIKKTDALKHYDFVAGVPHPESAPSVEDKLKALIGILRKTGMIPYVAFNAAPGDRDAVPYWKASIERRKPTDKLSDMESFAGKGLIEVNPNEN